LRFRINRAPVLFLPLGFCSLDIDSFDVSSVSLRNLNSAHRDFGQRTLNTSRVSRRKGGA
jgi:hypothetical protein